MKGKQALRQRVDEAKHLKIFGGLKEKIATRT